MQSNEITAQIQLIRGKLASLPPNEFTYYINVLLACIINEGNTKAYKLLLKQAELFVDSLISLYAHHDKAPMEIAQDLKEVVLCLDRFITAAFPYRSNRVVDLLSKIVGVCCGLLSGALFGIVGAVIGIVYGLPVPISGGWFKSSTLGMMSGLMVGFLVGYRAPSKVCNNEFTLKIDYCIQNLERLGKELSYKKSYDDYYQETKQYILETFYSDGDDSQQNDVFQSFLNGSHQFQVCTTTAGHISRQLKGFMGHHSYIRFKINGKVDIPIEFGGRKGTPNFVNQYEYPRSVSGQTLYDMLVLDRILQETHSGLKTSAKLYEVGSNDCRTYTDKILLGTGQDPTMISRFSKATDKYPGYRMVRPMVRFFSRIREDELHCLIDDKSDPKFTIQAESWDEWEQHHTEHETENSWSGWDTCQSHANL